MICNDSSFAIMKESEVPRIGVKQCEKFSIQRHGLIIGFSPAETSSSMGEAGSSYCLAAGAVRFIRVAVLDPTGESLHIIHPSAQEKRCFQRSRTLSSHSQESARVQTKNPTYFVCYPSELENAMRSPSAKRAGGQKKAESAFAKLRKEKKRRIKIKVYPTQGYALYKPVSNSWYGRFAMEIKLKSLSILKRIIT